MVGEEAAVIRINAGRDSGAINDRGAWINRMMISKRDSALRQFPKRRRILFAHKIRTHSVPNHHHDMFAAANLSVGGSIL